MCKDPLVKKLNKCGYTPVKMPRDDVDPLHVFVKPKRDLEKLGSVTKIVLQSTEPVPPVVRDGIAPDFSSENTRSISIKVGAEYIGNYFSALGFPKLAAEAGFTRADSLVFHYDNIRKDYIDPFDIDKYLRHATPDTETSFFRLLDEYGEGYIITELLKSKSFGISAYDKNGYAIKVDIPILQALTTVRPDIKIDTEKKDVITFTGETPLCFAFKPFNLWIDAEKEPPKFRFAVPKGKKPQKERPTKAAEMLLFQPSVLKKDDLIGIGGDLLAE